MQAILTSTQCKAARALLALDQQELDNRAQVEIAAIADFERGKRTLTDTNLEAIVQALVASGISFVDGEVKHQPSATTNRPLIATGTARLRLIEATDLNQWAERNDGKHHFPELIERLIQASLGYVPRQFIFRSGDSTQQGGWDGICEQDNNAMLPWLPVGVSGWELGAQADGIKKKADEDYEARTANPLNLDPSQKLPLCSPLRGAGLAARPGPIREIKRRCGRRS